MLALGLYRSLVVLVIATVVAACGSTTSHRPTPNSGQSSTTATGSATATPSALAVVYQAINSSDPAIHEATIHGSAVTDRILVNDKTISFLLGFTGSSTIGVRKDMTGTTEVGTIDISTGAYHQVYSLVQTPTREMLGPELSPDGTRAAFEDQNGLTIDWVLLDMATGQTKRLNITNGGGIVVWTPSYILFNSSSGLVEVDPSTGAQSPVANSSDYDAASLDGTHLAGVVHRDLADPGWCMNTIVTRSQGADEVVVAAGKNRAYRVLAVTNTGDILFSELGCGPSLQAQDQPTGNGSVWLWHSGQVSQQFSESATDIWRKAKFVGGSSALVQRDTLSGENTPEGPANVVTGSQVELVNLCSVSGCQQSAVVIGQAKGQAASYLYFLAPM